MCTKHTAVRCKMSLNSPTQKKKGSFPLLVGWQFGCDAGMVPDQALIIGQQTVTVGVGVMQGWSLIKVKH